MYHIQSCSLFYWNVAVIFRRLLKIAKRETVSFIVSVRLCARMEQLGSHWKDFHEIWYLNILQKSAQKIQVTLKCDKNNRYFTWRPMYIDDSFFLNSSDKFVGKIITFISFSIYFFFSENCAFREIMWKNLVHPHKPQTTVTNTHSEYIMLIYLSRQQLLREGSSYLICMYIASLGQL